MQTNKTNKTSYFTRGFREGFSTVRESARGLSASLIDIPKILNEARLSVKSSRAQAGDLIELSDDECALLVRRYRWQAILAFALCGYTLFALYAYGHKMEAMMALLIFFTFLVESAFRLSQIINRTYYPLMWFLRHRLCRPLLFIREIMGLENKL